MSIRTSPWPNGVPCWADVMATDVRASGAFYTAVLGWTVPEPEEQWGGYVTAEAAGSGRRHRAAAGGARRLDAVPRDRRRDGLVATAPEHGGTVLAPVMDVGPLGPHGDPRRPAGAAFGLWQAGTMIGASLVNEPGRPGLGGPALDRPRRRPRFYGALFGYEYEAVEMAGPDYATSGCPSEPHARRHGRHDGPARRARPATGSSTSRSRTPTPRSTAAEAPAGRCVAPRWTRPFGRMAWLADPGRRRRSR
jgi:predicted enzyme related to lactoylglutathione lyase